MEVNKELSPTEDGIEVGKRITFVCFMLEYLAAKGSRCQLFHVQKACYLAQQILDAPLEYDFVRKKYGPYSFQLSEEIELAQLNLVIYCNPENFDEGPAYELYDDLKKEVDRRKDTYPHMDKINFIAEWLNHRRAKELEILASVLMVKQELGDQANAEAIVAEVCNWKPRFDEQTIRDAIAEVAAKQAEARQAFPALAKSA